METQTKKPELMTRREYIKLYVRNHRVEMVLWGIAIVAVFVIWNVFFVPHTPAIPVSHVTIP